MQKVKHFIGCYTSFSSSQKMHDLLMQGFSRYWSFLIGTLATLGFLYIGSMVVTSINQSDPLYLVSNEYLSVLPFLLNMAFIFFSFSLLGISIIFFVFSVLMRRFSFHDLSVREYVLCSLYFATITSSFVFVFFMLILNLMANL